MGHNTPLSPSHSGVLRPMDGAETGGQRMDAVRTFPPIGAASAPRTGPQRT